MVAHEEAYYDPTVENLLVPGTHSGLVTNKYVYKAVVPILETYAQEHKQPLKLVA